MITDLAHVKTITPSEDPETGALYIANYEFPGVESYYWLAPTNIFGNLITLYGNMNFKFKVGWEAMRGDTSGQPTVGPNIVLIVSRGEFRLH